MESLKSIGQVSSNIGISIRTIRYYEEVGILKPTKTSDSHYRYYGCDEIDKLRIIIFLKKMGFSLQEIKTILADNSGNSLVAMIKDHQRQLNTDVEQINIKKEILELLEFTITNNGVYQISQQDIIKEFIMNKKEHINMVQEDNLPIRVIGIGNGSINAMNQLVESGIKMDFIHMDSDTQTLSTSKAYHKIQVGDKYTNGFGTSSNYQLGEKVVREDFHHIREAIKGSEILFILACMGGGLGSSAASIIAHAARRMGIVTVGVIVNSSNYNSEIFRKNAETGVQKLKENVDWLLEVSEESIQNVVISLSSIILVPGVVNVDIEDFKFLIRDRGIAYFGVGRASGDNRAQNVVEQALSCPTLYKDIIDADNIIINITGSKDLSSAETTMILEIMLTKIKPEAHILFRSLIDEEMKDSIEVFIIAGYKYI